MSITSVDVHKLVNKAFVSSVWSTFSIIVFSSRIKHLLTSQCNILFPEFTVSAIDPLLAIHK
jgi:hypothetical protein